MVPVLQKKYETVCNKIIALSVTTVAIIHKYRETYENKTRKIQLHQKQPNQKIQKKRSGPNQYQCVKNCQTCVIIFYFLVHLCVAFL